MSSTTTAAEPPTTAAEPPTTAAEPPTTAAEQPTTAAEQPTIGVELEFLVVNPPESTGKEVSSEDKRWPPVPNPDANSDHPDDESLSKICKFLKDHDQRYQVACVFHKVDTQDRLMDQDGKLVREISTSDEQFKIHALLPNSNIGKGKEYTDYRVWNTELKLDCDSPRKLPLRFTICNFQSEYTVGSKSNYPALEMRTPIISKSKQKEEFLAIVETLKKNFKITINANCGLHIHAGYESDPPQASKDLWRAKRIAAIVFMLEKPFIRALCHPDRKKARELKLIGQKSEYAKTARNARFHVSCHSKFKNLIESIRQFRNQLGNRSSKEAFVFRFLEVLFSEAKIPDLESEHFEMSLKKGGTRTSLAFRSDTKTIEFRYFECTFDTHMIKFWIKFVQQIFSICNKAKVEFEAEFKDLYEMATREEQKPGWEDWLKKLGLSEYQETCERYIKWCKDWPLDESRILPESFNS